MNVARRERLTIAGILALLASDALAFLLPHLLR
jgi:hypothetical protein